MGVKVWTKAVWQMTDDGLEFLPAESVSFDYSGPVALAKGGGSAPPPPDPYVTAAAQTEQNKDSALYNAMLNRVNTYTPLGSQEYSITGTDPKTGAPIYRQDIKLSPEQQKLYDQKQRQNLQLGDVAGGMLGSVGDAYGQPFSLSGLPQRGEVNTNGLPNLPTDYSDLRKQQSDALYDRNTAYLDPQFERSEEQMRSRLANQGIVEGSEAYKNAVDDFERGREMSYRQARDEAIAGGGEEAERAFGINSAARGQLYGENVTGANFANQNRNQALAEMLTARNQPLNEFNALRSASPVNMPQFQGMAQVGTNPADIAGAIQNQYQGQLDAYNAKQQSRNSLMGTLGGLGSAAMFAFSDERLKEDIHDIGDLNDGTTLYSYRYKGDPAPQVGVIAQEIEKKDPSAVRERMGFKQVDYAKVLANALGAS